MRNTSHIVRDDETQARPSRNDRQGPRESPCSRNVLVGGRLLGVNSEAKSISDSDSDLNYENGQPVI